jgi:4-O-beta-D-mannosyl-D-glucose phosphorylase
MASSAFLTRLSALKERHRSILTRPNAVDPAWDNGWYQRYLHPVLTAEHVPLDWRYDFDESTNPRLLERMAVNSVFNAGAFEVQGKICLVCRVEGADRKSFFAIAESPNGIDQFNFWDEPILLPQTAEPDVNVYDMRVTLHEDGCAYGTFCTERKDPNVPFYDTSSAVAACGIVRTQDFVHWERLPDLVSESPQQRNVVLHPKFVDGQYAFYTRPQDGFIETGSGGGIAWALCRDIGEPRIGQEQVIDPRRYHTVNEVKNGMGAPPIETDEGWLHIAHGVRNTAAGLRYVLYAFLCAKDEPYRVIHRPGGYFLAPRGDERIGDVSNVVFSNGVVVRPSGDVFIYYGSSDTRTHVATTTVATLLDYVKNTPEDPLCSHRCVEQRVELIRRNRRRA